MIDILHMVQHVQVSKVVTNVCSQWLFHLCVKGRACLARWVGVGWCCSGLIRPWASLWMWTWTEVEEKRMSRVGRSVFT